MLKIGELARLAQVSVKALRYYDRIGLLSPATIDRFSGYRYYDPDQLARLNRILALKDLGFSLEQIADLLREDLPVDALRGMLRLRQAELRERLAQEGARLQRVEARLRMLDRGDRLPDCEVVLKRVDPLAVYSLRQRLDRPDHLAALVARLAQGLGRDPQPHPANPVLAIYHDDEYQSRGLDVEVAMPVAGGQRLRLPQPLVQRTLSGYEQVACALCRAQGTAPGEQLAGAQALLQRWTSREGLRLSAPYRELYLSGLTAAEPTVVEVQWPVSSLLQGLTAALKERIMNPKIVRFPETTIVGVRVYGKNMPEEIGELWNGFGARIPEIAHITAPQIAYGYCVVTDPNDDGAFEYVAAVGVSRADAIPDEMVARTIPAGEYAVFESAIEQISVTWRYAQETWFPNSGYQRSGAPDFELYDETFEHGNPESRVFVYIPIAR